MKIPPRLLLFRRQILARLYPEFLWPVTVKLDRVEITLRGTPYSFGTKYLIKKGSYELEERQLLQKILKPGMQVIEMGGSIGVLSAVIAGGIGRTGRLVTVEASETITTYSKKWLPTRGNVEVVTGFAFPVNNAKGVSINQFDETAGSLGGKVAFQITSNADESEQTGLYDISTICERFHIQPELLVVDVEGSEAIMLQRKADLPSSLKYILIELHKGIYQNGIADEAAIVDTIKQEGFTQKAHQGDVYLFERVTKQS